MAKKKQKTIDKIYATWYFKKIEKNNLSLLRITKEK